MSNPSLERTRRPAARQRSRLIALAGVLGLAIATLAPATASAASTTVTGDDVGCPGHWPAAVQGKPMMYASGARAGDYLWHDTTGWHLRVTKVTSSRAVFAGRIRSNKPMTVAGVVLEGEDRFTLSADRLTLTYRFVNHGHVDGLDFRTACADRLGFAGSMDGVKLPTTRIWIGRNGRHPLQNPFVIGRVH